MPFKFCSVKGRTIMHQFRGGSRRTTAPLPPTPQHRSGDLPAPKGASSRLLTGGCVTF